jgi:hypothetical protein
VIALDAFIDIEGTFDNTFFHAIAMAVRELGVEETCCRWIGSMLKNSLVLTTVTGCSLTAKVVGGCPQGGVLSPILWNLVADRLLIKTNDIGYNTYGYADDIFSKIQGKLEHTVREIMQEALNVVAIWARQPMRD